MRERGPSSRRRRDFLDAMAGLELLAWSNEDFVARLAAQPRAVLGEFGIRVPDSVRVVLVPSEDSSPMGTVSAQVMSAQMAQAVAAWECGWPAGEVLIAVPADRHVPTGALSDDELAAVIGGHRATGCYVHACCAAG